MKTIPIVLLFFISFVFANCSDEPSCPDASESYSYMPEEYKRILPYTGFDTLRFLTNTNDTIICIGQGRFTFFTTQYKEDPNPDCGVYLKINYEGYKDQYNAFDVIHSFSPLPSFNYWISSYKINWKGAKFMFDNLGVGRKVESVNLFYDSLTLNDFVYYKVTEFNGINENDKIFINKSNGIIKLFNSATQETLNLISK